MRYRRSHPAATVTGRGRVSLIAMTAIGLAWLLPPAASASEAPAAAASGGDDGRCVILAEWSPWRVFPVWQHPRYRTDDGRVESRSTEPGLSWGVETPLPPGDWAEVDFDDRGWWRVVGPDDDRRRGQDRRDVGQVFLRLRFEVDEPEAVRGLLLSMTFRGGAAVYLNGREVARSHLPDGPLTAKTLAKDYPEAAFAQVERGDEAAAEAREAVRQRRMDGVDLPASALRHGVNVLAVRLHRAPYPGEALERGSGLDVGWPTVGLLGLQLFADPAGSVRPNTARSHPPGVRAWTAETIEDVGTGQRWGDPVEGIRPIRLVAPRGATVSGQAVVSSDSKVSGVRARITGLPDDIGARIRYPATTTAEAPFEAPRFDVLLDEPATDGRVQPVWLTLTIPPDAEPGRHTATLEVEADGLASPAQVPVELKVHPWRCPEPRRWSSFVSLNHSPHAVAWHYGVEMWSGRHIELLRPSLELMGKLGNDVVFIDVIHPTFFANEHGIIVFRRDGDGHEPDFRFFDRFLDAYGEHVGRPRRIILSVWEPHLADDPQMAHRDRSPGAWRRRLDYLPDEAPGTVTLTRIGDDGTLEHFAHPMHGSEGSAPLWRATLEGVRRRVLERGWDERSILLGMAHDVLPDERTVEFFHQIAPFARWAIFTHGRGHPPIRDGKINIRGIEVGLQEYPYGQIGRRTRGPGLGWVSDTIHGGWVDDPYDALTLWCGRNHLRRYSPLEHFRNYGDTMVAGRSAGFARLGIDLWPVRRPGDDLEAPPSRPVHGVGGYSRLYRDNPRSIAVPGPEGAVPTTRFEMLRESLQEAEARIFIERILMDEDKTQRIDPQLIERFEQLSQHRRAYRLSGGYRTLWLGPAWMDRTDALFDLAGHFEAALREEQP